MYLINTYLYLMYREFIKLENLCVIIKCSIQLLVWVFNLPELFFPTSLLN